MKRIFACFALSVLTLGTLTSSAHAGKWTAGMIEGKPAFQSMGPLSFGPEGVLFIADTKGAAIVAVATDDMASSTAKPMKVEGVNQKIAGMLGTTAEEILIEDMAVNPVSHNTYLAVSRGRGPEAVPVLVRVKTDGKIEAVSLDNVKYSRAELPNPPKDMATGRNNPRRESITDIAFVEDRLVIAGLSNEEFASTLRAVDFPFKAMHNGTSVEIYHGAHGGFETRAPVRTFAPFKVGNEVHLLAAYTCTPLVQFSFNELKPGAKIKGKTIAELGNRNRPLDMVVYQRDGKNYLLMANSSRGVMKISTEDINKVESIVAPVPDGEKKGLTYETIADWKGVDQLDSLDSKHVVVLRRADDGAMTLEALPLP